VIALLALALASAAPVVPADPVLERAGAYVIPGYVQPLGDDPDEESPGLSESEADRYAAEVARAEGESPCDED